GEDRLVRCHLAGYGRRHLRVQLAVTLESVLELYALEPFGNAGDRLAAVPGAQEESLPVVLVVSEERRGPRQRACKSNPGLFAERRDRRRPHGRRRRGAAD